MTDLETACAAYFQQNPGFHRAMEQLLIRYQRYGCAAGTIRLDNASQEEREALRGLFGRPFPGKVAIKAQDFQTALQATRFAGVDLKAVLEGYFHTSISTSRERRDQKEQQFEALLESGRTIAKSEASKNWLEAMGQKPRDRGYPLLIREMSRDFQSAAVNLQKAIWAMDFLEDRRRPMLRLAVFSAQATTDPHALDSDTFCGQLFLHLLAMKQGRPYPASAEERDEVFFESGILCDSISSTVTQVGLILWEGEGEHPAFRAFRERGECCTLSLTNLNSIASAESPSGKAYLVENQMLYAQLCDQAEDFHSPLICTSGQLQVAVLRLLDMLAASGTTLYYAGDFDGGGISIAARLLARYPDKLRLWHMDIGDYAQCKSEVPLSENSRNLLKAARGTALEPLANAVQETGYAGYQELLLNKLLPDLTVPAPADIIRPYERIPIGTER